MNLKYLELLKIKNLQVEYVGNPELLDKEIQGFSISSKTIHYGEAFIAIKGERFDAHNFVTDVLKNGNSNCIVSKIWFQGQEKADLPGNFFLVSDTLLALQEISHYYRLKFDIPIIALTGSNGKTTTKEMIAAVLGEKFKVLKTEGNLNNHIGLPLTLFKLNSEYEIAVIEMGTNSKGEITRLAEIGCPTHGLITNIGPAHLEFFGTLEGVSEAKRELWQNLEKDEKTAFINIDDPFLRKNIPAVKKIITYGFENPADVQGKFIRIDKKGRAVFQVNETEINLKIAGIHNIYNALAAVTVGLNFNLNMEQIKSALESFHAADKRMQVIEKKGIIIINDCYNSNPESAKNALLTLSQMETKGRRIAVLGDMFELGKSGKREHESVGEYLSSLKKIDLLLTLGPLSELTAEQAKKTGTKNSKHYSDKKKLINHLKSDVKKGDLILIKGSRGMAMEEVTNVLTES